MVLIARPRSMAVTVIHEEKREGADKKRVIRDETQGHRTVIFEQVPLNRLPERACETRQADKFRNARLGLI